MQQSYVQLPAIDPLPKRLPSTDDAPVMLGMPGLAPQCTGVPHRQAETATGARTDAWDAQGVADLQRGANAQMGSDAWGADAQGGADMQGGAQGGADSIYGYLEQLPQELVACRRVLQYSFVLEYYMQGSAHQARSEARPIAYHLTVCFWRILLFDNHAATSGHIYYTTCTVCSACTGC